jgi:hypothetical protein
MIPFDADHVDRIAPLATMASGFLFARFMRLAAA